MVYFQFRFADFWDYVLMFVGTAAAMCHGTVYVASNLVLGNQIDVFVDYQKASDYINQFINELYRHHISMEDVWRNKSLLEWVCANLIKMIKTDMLVILWTNVKHL